MRRWVTIAVGLAVFALERGLDVSGVVNMRLAIALWVSGGLLLAVGALLSAWPVLRRLRCQEIWLHAVADADRCDLSRALAVDSFSADHRQLGSANPHVDFHFRVFNGSVFTISVDSVEGHVRYQDQPLKDVPELVNTFKEVPHAKRGGLTMRQYLLPDAARLIVDSRALGGTKKFHFADVTVWVTTDDPKGKGRKYRLPLPNVAYKDTA